MRLINLGSPYRELKKSFVLKLMRMICSSGDHVGNEGKVSLLGVIGALLGSPGSGAVCLSVVRFNQRSPLLAPPAG